MAIGAERLSVDPCLRKRVDDLIPAAAKQMRRDGGGRNFHQHDMIQSNLVETVLQRKATLDFMGLDHRRQHVAYREWRAPGARIAGAPIGNGKYAAQIIRWMSPFRRQPGVVEIEPANHRAD